MAHYLGLNTPCQAWDYQTSELAPTGENTIVTFDARGVGWTGTHMNKAILKVVQRSQGLCSQV